MESRLQFNDVTFEISNDEDNSAPERYLTNTNTKTPEQLLLSDDTQKHQQQQLYKALSALDERSLDILQSRYLKEEKTTLHTLAHKYGVSAERVRQLENKAMQPMLSPWSFFLPLPIATITPSKGFSAAASGMIRPLYLTV
jgi:RNA polymerase sigma-32 factor